MKDKFNMEDTLFLMEDKLNREDILLLSGILYKMK